MKVRLQVAEGGPSPRTPSALDVQWRGVANLEHGTLCRSFGLDPVRHRWDLSRSAHVGSGSAYEGRGSRPGGYLERHEFGEWRVIGKLEVVHEGERFRDLDPTDPRDVFSLNETR